MASVRVAVVTDIHAAPAGSPAGGWHDAFEPARGGIFANAAAELLERREFDLLFVLGDLSNEGDERSIEEAVLPLVDLGAPTWVVAGNHDLRGGGALKRTLDRIGGPVQIASPSGDDYDGAFIVAGLAYVGESDDQVRLERAPAVENWSDAPLLLLSHYPLISRVQAAADAGKKYAGDARDIGVAPTRLAARNAPAIAFHGHLHLDDAVVSGSLLQLGFPALIENGHRIALVEIEGDGSSMTLTISSFSADGDSRPPAAIGAPPRTWTYANGQWRA